MVFLEHLTDYLLLVEMPYQAKAGYYALKAYHEALQSLFVLHTAMWKRNLSRAIFQSYGGIPQG